MSVQNHIIKRDLILIINMKSKIENFEKWNDLMFKKYNPERYYKSKKLLIRYTTNKRLRCIMSLASIDNYDHILDIGCGSGILLERIKVGDRVGIDLSDSALSIAKKRFKNNEVRLIKGDIQRISEVLNTKFDKIFCADVIEHVNKPNLVIDEIIKVSKPTSTIIFSIPNEKFINILKKIFLRLFIYKLFLGGIPKDMHEEWHLTGFSLNLFKKFTKNKFEIINIKRTPFWFLPINYIIKCKIKQ